MWGCHGDTSGFGVAMLPVCCRRCEWFGLTASGGSPEPHIDLQRDVRGVISSISVTECGKSSCCFWTNVELESLCYELLMVLCVNSLDENINST